MMRKILLTLMVLFAVLGGALTGATTFVNMKAHLKGFDYEELAKIEKIIAEAKETTGVDLLEIEKDPSKIKIFKKVLSFPSKTMVLVIQVLSVLAIVIAIAMCITTFTKKDIAIKLSIILAVLSVVLIVIAPDLKSSSAYSTTAALRTLMGISVGVLIAAAASSFGAMKKIAK